MISALFLFAVADRRFPANAAGSLEIVYPADGAGSLEIVCLRTWLIPSRSFSCERCGCHIVYDLHDK